MKHNIDIFQTAKWVKEYNQITQENTQIYPINLKIYSISIFMMKRKIKNTTYGLKWLNLINSHFKYKQEYGAIRIVEYCCVDRSWYTT